jgi:uncharacterized protein (TIGR03066 family)
MTVLIADDKEEKIDAKKLVGKWKLSVPTKEGAMVTQELAADGKMTITLKFDDETKVRKGTYKIEGNKLTVTWPVDDKSRSETHTVTKLTDTEMAMEDEKGQKYTLKRIEEKK